MVWRLLIPPPNPTPSHSACYQPRTEHIRTQIRYREPRVVGNRNMNLRSTVAAAITVSSLGCGRATPTLGQSPAPASPTFDRSSLDTTCAPCRDFFQFANGGWLARTEIPGEFPSWGSFNELYEHNLDVLHDLLEAAARDSVAPPGSNRGKLGRFYGTCMDSAAAEAAASRPLQPELDRIGAVNAVADVQGEVARLQRAGITALFTFTSDQDAKHSTEMIAEASQGGLGLPDRDYYTKTDSASEQLRREYVAHMARTLELLGTGGDEARSAAQKVMAIETALAQAYVERRFSPEAKRRALEMVNNLEAVMRDRLHGLGWMSDATWQQALAKLATYVNKIGYPDRWRDYSALAVERGPFITNVRRAQEFETQRQLTKIGKPVDRGEWGMTPPTVNAYYNQAMNEIVFPAGILQPPFFSPDADDAINYGGMGAVIGHELTHGFDDEGRQYDADGNLRDWWTKADAERVQAQAQLVVHQFAGFVAVDTRHVNGELTLGENLADLSGLRIAYAAFEQSRTGKPRPPLTDGFTPEQRFFLGFAQMWRTKVRDELARLYVIVDPHAPPRWRVNGPLSNMTEFRKAFRCTASDPLVRPDSLQPRIW